MIEYCEKSFDGASPVLLDFGKDAFAYLELMWNGAESLEVSIGDVNFSTTNRFALSFMVSSFVFFRQAYLFVMANYISNTIMPIAMSYPAGWLVASIASSVYYRFTDLTKTRVVEKKAA